MKVSESKPHSVHLRLTDEQWAYCAGNAELMGVGVADFIRMLVNTMSVTSQKVKEAATLGNLGGTRDENTPNA